MSETGEAEADPAVEDDPSIDALLREAARIPKLEPDRAGTVLGRYRIVEKLGEGAMGVVHAAEDQALGRRVAIKVLPRAALSDDERRRRFLREARAAAAVHHPNLAAVFDVSEAGGTIFIAMELVAGRSLRARLVEAGGRLPVDEAVAVAAQIARGLGKAHEAGVVHRDLKPENVMLAADGTAKVVDFGLATHRARAAQDASTLTTEEGRILGTPSYMSPEQARGRRAGPPADVFSLGVVLYEMVTGERPFAGASGVDVLAAITRDDPVSPSRRAAGIPRALDRLILRCLAKDPTARYLDGNAVAHALAHLGTPRRSFPVVAVAVAAASLAVAALASRPTSPPVRPAEPAERTASQPPPAPTPVVAPVPDTALPAHASSASLPNAAHPPPAGRVPLRPVVTAPSTAPDPLARQK